MKRIVYQYRSTNIAAAPSELALAINKFSDKYHCIMVGFNSKNIIPNSCDILHAHNVLPKRSVSAKKILQYHSEPFQVDLKSPVSERLVIAQYHATLPEYSSCTVVRNVIDFTSPQYDPKTINDVIRIGFSPSRVQKFGQWHDKGYSETVAVLNKIKKIYGPFVEIDIITGVSLHECINRKSKCNIIIDECVTASYHRSGLEGLALGKLTICSLSPKVEQILLNSSGAKSSPFVNIWINDLEIELCRIIDSGILNILEKGKESRHWMNRFWHPKTIISEFTKIYDSL